jgi:CubicO group peptidase (beta-lactamase class C family)
MDLGSVLTPKTTCLLVYSNGHPIFEHGDPARPSYLASARKSLLSLLYGRAVTEGRIDLGATLADLDIDDTGGLSAQDRRATVRALLTSTSGIRHPAATPGSRGVAYNNWDFNALGTIYERCTGRAVFTALAEDLAEPLGFEDYDPARQRLLGRPDLSQHLAHHMFLSPRDLARVGLSLLGHGPRVVPEPWLRESTSVQVDHGLAAPMDYGYLWWLPRRPGGFLALGNYGQYMWVRPDRDQLVVHQRALPDDFAVARNQGTWTGPEPEGVSLPEFLGLCAKLGL